MLLLCFFFWHRYKQEQATVQDELFKVASREREAARKHQRAFLHRGKGSVDQEKQNSALLVSADLPELAFGVLEAQRSRSQAWDLISLNPGAQPTHLVSSKSPLWKGYLSSDQELGFF